jgi:hypothetical protein
LPFKCNLQRYAAVVRHMFKDNADAFSKGILTDIMVGLCTLNQVDPYPITYSLSNP